MANAVSDEMLAASAISGTPDECRRQLAAYDGLIDTAIRLRRTPRLSASSPNGCWRTIA